MYQIHDFCNTIKLRLCLMEELPANIIQVDNAQLLTFWESLDEESKNSCLKLECQTIIEHVLEKLENTEFIQSDMKLESLEVKSLSYDKLFDSYQDSTTCRYMSLFEFVIRKNTGNNESACETSEQSFSDCYSSKISKDRYSLIQTKSNEHEEFITIMSKLFPSFLNGQKVALQKKYYQPFFYEISQYLLYSEKYGKSNIDSIFICVLAISMLFENNIIRRYKRQCMREKKSSKASISQTENESTIQIPLTIPIIMNEGFLQLMEEQPSFSCFEMLDINDLNLDYNFDFQEDSHDTLLSELDISRELEDLHIELALKKLENDKESPKMIEEKTILNQIPLVKAIQPLYYLLPNLVQHAPMMRVLPSQPIRINSFVPVKPFPAYLNHNFFRKNVKGIRELVLEPNFAFNKLTSSFSNPIYQTGPMLTRK